MITVKEAEREIATMEGAVIDLLEKAKVFDGTGNWRTRELLAAAREYARAVNRVTRVSK